MPSPAPSVTVSTAAPGERRLIEGLVQFYIYDFSEMETAGSPRFEPGADGRFEDYPELPRYWTDPSREALVIRANGRPAGFALLNTTSHSGMPLDRNMGEFFVMRKHRRSGVASAAVADILRRRPGCWEIAIAERNHPARAFWPRAVAAARGVFELVTLEGDGINWTGPILRFKVGEG